MLTKETIEQCLESVIVPAAARTVTGLNLIRDIDINNENITVKLARTALNEGTQEWLREKITEAVKNAEKDAKISELETQLSDANSKLDGLSGLTTELQELKDQNEKYELPQRHREKRD